MRVIGIDPGTSCGWALLEDGKRLGSPDGSNRPPAEEWRSIEGYSRYEVSSEGRVRSLTRFKGGKTMRQTDNRCGYLYVGLCRDNDRKQIKEYVHRLVLLAFVGLPPGEGYQASHLNGDRQDNRLENLCWEPVPENNRRKRDHGTAQRGERIGTSKLTEADVQEIRRLAPNRPADRVEIAEQFGITPGHVKDIVKRRCWRHIP